MNTLNNDTIFIISTSLNLGGSEIQAVRLANYLSKTGKNVQFISLKQGGILKENLEKNINLKEYNYIQNQFKIFQNRSLLVFKADKKQSKFWLEKQQSFLFTIIVWI